MARPTKLNASRQATIVAMIETGNYLETAARAAGVDYGCFRDWMIRGEKEQSGIFRQFYQAVVLAEAVAEAKIVAMWSQAATLDWRAGKELLERRHPQRWRMKNAIEVTGPELPPFAIPDARARFTGLINAMVARTAASKVNDPEPTQ